MRLRIWLRCVGATLLLGACGAAGGPEDVLAEVDEADAVIASRVLVLKNLSAAGGREYAAAVKKACEPAAAACLCSRGCPTTWRGCTPSALCGLSDAATTVHAATRRTPNTTILLYLTFSRTLVRHKYRGNPMRAYRREAARIEWYLHSGAFVSPRPAAPPSRRRFHPHAATASQRGASTRRCPSTSLSAASVTRRPRRDSRRSGRRSCPSISSHRRRGRPHSTRPRSSASPHSLSHSSRRRSSWTTTWCCCVISTTSPPQRRARLNQRAHRDLHTPSPLPSAPHGRTVAGARSRLPPSCAIHAQARRAVRRHRRALRSQT